MGKKQQTTIYITEKIEQMVNRLIFLRANRNDKTNRSELFCEGLKALYEKEFKESE